MVMRPLYLDDRFAWLHTPPGGIAPGARGVVLCPAFGQEEVCTHYGLMALADQLAARGMIVARFDYAGTGDSVDTPLTVAGLVEDAQRAAALLRREGAVDITLAGVRLGAAIALTVATATPDLSALVLLAPVLSGQAFLRETRAGASVASLSGLDPVPPIDGEVPLNTNGFHWPPAFQQEINALDLSNAPAPTVPVLTVPARGDRRVAKIVQRWQDAGATISDIPFLDYEEWMQDPTTNQNPVATFDCVTDWLARIPHTTPAAAPLPRTDGAPAIRDTLATDRFVEEPLRFGQDGALFGVLCRPATGAAAPIAALLLHEGSTHHIGNGRAYVRLARRLAEAGYASLRMDLTGMGDSPAGDNPRHPHYDPERIVEGVAGMDRLAALGFRHAMTFGLCSGAHTALQVVLVDERIVGGVSLNLQKFIWHYGDDIRVATRDNKRSLKGYLRAMRNAGEWRRALSGKADLTGIARVLLKRAVIRTRHTITGLFPPAPGSETAQVRAQLRTLSQRRAHVHLVFSDEDPGLAEIAMQFGRGARRLAHYPPLRLTLLREADHHFNGSSVRRRYMDLVVGAMDAVVADHGAGLPPVTFATPAGADPRAMAAE